jgi:hypothetical protein
MNRLVVCTSIAVSVLAGCATLAPSAAPTQGTASTPAPVATLGATPSPTGAFGGIVHYQLDGAPATTEIDAVANGASVSGTAVTAFRAGTHTVQLACAAQNGDTWVLGGTTERSTIHGEAAGTWSAVIVKDGSPQQIAIWLSADPSDASDCEAWLASVEPAEFEPGTFSTVESGALLPPPASAP